MYNVKSCSVGGIKNTGKSDCLNLIGAHAKILLTLPDFEVDTLENAKLEETWATAIQERKVFPLYDVMGFEDQSDEDGVMESSTGLRRIPTSQGNYQFEYHFVPPVYNLIGAYSFNGRRMRVVIIDGNNKVIGTTPDGTKFVGFDCSRVEVKKIKQPESQDQAAYIPMVMELTSPVEYKENLATFEADFAPTLMGLHDVDLALVGDTPDTADTTFVLSVERTSDESPVIGLVAADFTGLKDGADFAISSIEPLAATPNHYTITTAALAAAVYVFDLKAPSAMTTTGYQSLASVTFTTTP